MLIHWGLRISISTKLLADADAGLHAHSLSNKPLEVSKQWPVGQGPDLVPVCFYHWSFIGTHLFVSMLSMAAFRLQWQNLVAAAETVWFV